jgi:uroporphyrinogen decarboxylase
MHNSHWNDLKGMAEGRQTGCHPVGFIIDSPWLPGWYGITTLDYYSSDDLWLRANLKAASTFPDVWFMPGFWSEYGMCTEPSAFGSKMVFSTTSLPHASSIIRDISEAESLIQPDFRTDGMLPFMINRLRHAQNSIRNADHEIRFAVSRGPLNIASFLMGTTEFMLALALDPDGSHRLIRKITTFIRDWISWQKECFPSIEGILILDDLIGFVGEHEFGEFVVPYMKEIFSVIDADIRFLHNDADGLITAKHLNDMNVNMFNFSYNHSMGVIRELAGNDVILLGNVPPRDVMALGKPSDVASAVRKAFSETDDHSRIVWSLGGGMPPDVKNENIYTFIGTVKELNQL